MAMRTTGANFEPNSKRECSWLQRRRASLLESAPARLGVGAPLLQAAKSENDAGFV